MGLFYVRSVYRRRNDTTPPPQQTPLHAGCACCLCQFWVSRAVGRCHFGMIYSRDVHMVWWGG